MYRTRKTSREIRSCSNGDRYGAAIVEFAFCLPIFVLLVVGTIETCNVIYLRQSAKIAAYECARLGILPGVTRSDLEDQCALILNGRKIETFLFSCEPQDPTTLSYEDLLTTTVSIPASEGMVIGNWFYKGEDIAEDVTIMAEY